MVSLAAFGTELQAGYSSFLLFLLTFSVLLPVLKGCPFPASFSPAQEGWGAERTATDKVDASLWRVEGCGAGVLNGLGMRGEPLPLHRGSYKNRHSSAAGVEGDPVAYK